MSNCLSLVCNERVCIQYFECLQQLSFINMFISLATKTYRRVHFVDSEARVEVGERRYGGTHLIFKKEPVKRDGECIWKDTYPRSSQSSVSCDHASIIAIEYLMPRIRSTARNHKGRAHTLNWSSWVLQATWWEVSVKQIDRLHTGQRRCLCGIIRVVYMVQTTLDSLAITWGEYRSTLE